MRNALDAKAIGIECAADASNLRHRLERIEGTRCRLADRVCERSDPRLGSSESTRRPSRRRHRIDRSRQQLRGRLRLSEHAQLANDIDGHMSLDPPIDKEPDQGGVQV
jgi:hypothetical protein